MRAVSLLLLLLLAVAPAAAAEEEEDSPVENLSPEEAGYSPYLRWQPTGASGRVDWLLVTTEELLPAFAPLVRHRRELGLAAEAITVRQISGDILLGGGDLPERLRNLVRHLHRRFGLKYLLLGADSGLLPSRMAPFGIRGEKVHYGELYAVEAYFGCLDGEWNADADAFFGEAEQGNDDRPDLDHEVHVGRVPAESVQEVEAFVAKVVRYERPIHLDYLGGITFLGGKVFVEDDADTHYRKVFADLFEDRGLKAGFFTRAGKGAALADVLRHLSEGTGIVSHYHHSFTYNLSMPSGAIDTGNYSEVANLDRPFVMFSNGCYANQFTKEGISERLLLSATGGPAAFLGSTNTCFSTSIGLERRFWEELLSGRARTLGEALSNMRAGVKQGVGVLGFLRLSLNLLGDPATPPWIGAPVRVSCKVEKAGDGVLRVTRVGKSEGRLWCACVQDGPCAAWRDPVAFEEGGDSVSFPPVIGNGSPLRITLFGERVVPVAEEVADPVPVRVTGLSVAGGKVEVNLAGKGVEDLSIPIPDGREPGSFVVEREVGGFTLRIAVPLLDGGDLAFERGGKVVRLPGFHRMAVPGERGIPVVIPGKVRMLAPGTGRGAPSGTNVEATDSTLRLTWDGEPGARWVVEREEDGKRRLLTPLPLVNPVFTLADLEPLSKHRLTVSRLGEREGATVSATTSFPYQEGFPQRIGANVTSIQVMDLDGRRGLEVLFGDDKLGLWALHADGREVRHAGDNWTFGLFAAIENGVFEPVVADIDGKRGDEILATSKLGDRKLYAFTRDGRPVKGFPVSFKTRLMSPPLVGDFDGKRGNEILVVSGFGKTVELVRPDGRKEPWAEIGQYNYGYPIAVNLDRDRALEVVILDGAGKVWALDQGGKPMKGFPVDLGSPGRCTPMVADLDGKRGLEIIAVGNGTTRLAVIKPEGGKVLAKLDIPGAGQPDNWSFFYPGLARLGEGKGLSIVAGTPSKKLVAIDLTKDGELVMRKGFPLDLPAHARGVAAVDIDGDDRDELFLSLHNGEVWALDPAGGMLPGFPLRTKADTYGVPLLADLDGDRDLELFLGAADGMLRVWDLPYKTPKRSPTWQGLQNGACMPGTPGD